MKNYTILIAGIVGALAVGIGAFGAHGLKPLLTTEQLEVFKTGSQYHFYHAITMLLIGVISGKGEHRSLSWAAGAMLAGILLFSGSLYLLASREVLGIENWKWLGPVTPIGGFCFILGWISLAIYGIQAASASK